MKWLFLFLVFLVGTFSFSAEISKINKKKKLVLINAGSDAGFTKDANVCFFNENDKKVACGVVQKSEAGKTFVKVENKKSLAKLKEGMKAVSDGTSSGGSGGSKPWRRNFKLLYTGQFLSPATYTRLRQTELAPGETKIATGNLYTQDKPLTSNLVAGGGELELPIGSSLSMTLGFRYSPYCASDSGKFSCSSRVESNVAVDAAGEATTPYYYAVKQSMTGLGFWSDLYVFDIMLGATSAFRLGVGLDFEMSTAKLSSSLMNSDTEAMEGEEFTVTSSLSIISLRLPLPISMVFGPIGILIGPTLMIPVMATTPTPKLSKDLSAGEPGFNTYLNHTKNSFAVEFTTGFYLAF